MEVDDTNQDVDDRSNDNGTISAQIGVGDETADERQQQRRAAPGIDVRRRRRRGLAQRPCQIAYQIRTYSIIRESLRHLSTYKAGTPKNEILKSKNVFD